MHEEAAVLERVLLESDVRDPILVGHSDGGSIALIAAGAGRARARALILEAPHVFVEQVTIDSIRLTAERYRTTDLRDRLARHHGGNVDALFEDWTKVWLSPEFRAWNIEGSLKGVACPTLVVQGEDDEYGTRTQADAIGAALGERCRTLMLANCRHTPHIDQRPAVERAMAEWVASAIRGR